MRKQIFYILTLLLAPFFFAGCTQNNGDLNGLFGTWKVESIMIDTAPDEAYKGNMFWVFQNDIVNMQVVDDLAHTSSNSFGTFVREDNLLTFNYTNSDNQYAPGTGIYAPPKISHLPASVFVLTILKLDGSHFNLRYIADDGTVYQYFLKKWG